LPGKVERANLENTFEAIALEWLGKQQCAQATARITIRIDDNPS
jgi:hypothetical protein